MHCLELVNSKNYLNHKKYVLRLFKMVANPTECSKLEQRSVMKFLMAEKHKACEIHRRMCDVYEEACLSQKMFINGWDRGLPLQARVEKTVDGVEIQWFSVMKRFWVQESVKKVILTVFSDMKKAISIDFLVEGATVNSASYCQLLSIH